MNEVCCEVNVSLFNPVEFTDTFVVNTSDHREAIREVLKDYSEETLFYLSNISTKLVNK